MLLPPRASDPSSRIPIFSFASYYSSCCDGVCSCITTRDSFPHPKSVVPPTPAPLPFPPQNCPLPCHQPPPRLPVIAPPGPPPQQRPASYLLAISMASLLGGGIRKQTEGTMASFPVGLITFHLVLWELSSSTHSSFLPMVICSGTNTARPVRTQRRGRTRLPLLPAPLPGASQLPQTQIYTSIIFFFNQAKAWSSAKQCSTLVSGEEGTRQLSGVGYHPRACLAEADEAHPPGGKRTLAPAQNKSETWKPGSRKNSRAVSLLLSSRSVPAVR